jgi:hypothetical protein
LRTTAGSALALLTAGALAAPATAATLQAPDSVAAREVVAVTATGLKPGKRWAVFLARDAFAGLPCFARLARRTAQADEPTVFSGVVASQLHCQVPTDVPSPPPVPVRPGGGYRFLVCVPEGDRCDEVPVARRPVNVVRTGRKCASVAFTPSSDHGAFGIRASNVTCAVARDVARGSEDGDLRYRRAGLRCRGVFDPAGLAQTIYRCTRPGARVTFSRS